VLLLSSSTGVQNVALPAKENWLKEEEVETCWFGSAKWF
jgi:hypothetical protein